MDPLEVHGDFLTVSGSRPLLNSSSDVMPHRLDDNPSHTASLGFLPIQSWQLLQTGIQCASSSMSDPALPLVWWTSRLGLFRHLAQSGLAPRNFSLEAMYRFMSDLRRSDIAGTRAVRLDGLVFDFFKDVPRERYQRDLDVDALSEFTICPFWFLPEPEVVAGALRSEPSHLEVYPVPVTRGSAAFD